jgi:hypothetical protein
MAQRRIVIAWCQRHFSALTAILHNLLGKPLHTFPDHALVWRWMANLPPRSRSPTFATVRTTLVIVERNPGVRLEARFALAAEHPDHDADERGDKN